VTVSRGLVIAGEVIPGTERVLRDSSAWLEPGDRGTRQRAATVDVLVGHWTGGEAGAGNYDDDGPRVLRGMQARKRPDGSPMDVGIPFVIGACAEDAAIAQVWQTADPGLTACVHVGDRPLNRRSVGVEIVSPGLPGPLDVRGRPRTAVPLLGRVRTVLRFYDGQLRAWVWLAETLAALDGRAGITIPRRVPSYGASARFGRVAARRWAGGMEHLHVPTTTKVDAAGLLVDALASAGWARAQP
jgi:hypothetical protein